jgi:hypothetical protein
MMAFILVCTLLLPLSWTICNGPKVAFVQMAGGVVALAWLSYRRQVFSLVKVSPLMAAGVLYAFMAYASAEPRDTYTYQAALMLLFYGIPAGLCLRRLAEGGRGGAVGWAMTAFAVGMAVIGLVILKNPEVQRITSESSGAFQRTNGNEDEVINYLRIFSISNVIIGIVPFTLFALAAFPAALTSRNLAFRLVVGTGAVVAAYTNVEIATRTTIMAAAVSAAVVMSLAFRSIPWRRLAGFAAGLAVIGLAGAWYVGRKADRFFYLLDRFSAMGSDSRLGIWAEAVRILGRTPDGHGIRQLQSHEWAHNLFLDVGLADGWVAIGAVGVMYCGVFFLLWRALRSPRFFDSGPNVIFSGWLLASFVASMILPPQAAFLATLHLALGYFAPCRSAGYAPAEDWSRNDGWQPLARN